MTCNESDEDEIAIKKELAVLEEKLLKTVGFEYDVAIKRKFLRHRIADLQYILKHPGVSII